MVEQILIFIYTGQNPHQAGSVPTAQEMINMANLYALAEKYGCASVKASLKSSFAVTARVQWNTVEFATAAKIVYDSTPESDRGLRDVIKSVAWAYHRGMTKKPDLLKLVNENIAFACDLARAAIEDAIASRPGMPNGLETSIRVACSNCNKNSRAKLHCCSKKGSSSVVHPPSTTYTEV